MAVSASADDQDTPTIIVTGERAGGQIEVAGGVGLLGDRSLYDTPFSLTNYGEELFENQQVRAVTDVLENSASIQRNGTRFAGFNAVVIRGFPFNGLDYAFDGLFGLYGRSNPIEGIGRVEILKGVGTLLNGVPPAGSIGGAINLVPKRAEAEPLTEITANYFSDAQFGGQVDLGRRFGADGAFGARANLVYRDGETSIDRLSEKVGVATLSLDWQGEGVRLYANAGYDYLYIDAPSPSVLPGAILPIPKAPSTSGNLAQSWALTTTERYFGTVRAEFDLGPGWTFSAAYGEAHTEAEALQTTVVLLSASGDFTYSPRYFPQIVDGRTLDLTLRGKFDTGPISHSVSLAATTLWLNQGSRLNPIAFAYRSNIYDPLLIPRPAFNLIRTTPVTNEQDRYGLAISDILSVWDERVQLILGGRQQDIRSVNYNVATLARTSKYEESAFTPAVGLLVKPIEKLSVYGSYIEALQQGPTAPLTGVDNPGEVFPPFVSTQYELGAKLDLGRSGLTLALFQITQPSGLVVPTATPGVGRFTVDGEQRNRGLEVEAFGEPVTGLRLLFSATALDAKFRRTANGVNDGKRAPGASKLRVSASVDWDPAFAPGLTLNGRAIHSSRQFVNPANTQFIPSSTRFDAGARYSFALGQTPVTLRATVQNLLDENYWETANSFGGELLLGTPRTVLASATVAF